MVAKRMIDGTNRPAEQPVAPSPRLRIKLDSAPLIERELARLYRCARGGSIPAGDASKLAHILWLLSRVREVGEIETRLAALEAADRVGA